MAQISESEEAWVVVGASRGIGLDFVRQLLIQRQQSSPSPSPSTGQGGVQVVAAVRDVSKARLLYELLDSLGARGRCLVEECDVSDEQSLVVCAPLPTLPMCTLCSERD